jgi:hypothetical protein
MDSRLCGSTYTILVNLLSHHAHYKYQASKASVQSNFTPTSDPRYRVCNFTPELPYLCKKLSNFIGQFPGYVGQLEADCIASPAPQQLRAPTARSVPLEILLLLLYPTE